MWHKPCRTFNPWCLCIKTRCLCVFLITNVLYTPYQTSIWYRLYFSILSTFKYVVLVLTLSTWKHAAVQNYPEYRLDWPTSCTKPFNGFVARLNLNSLRPRHNGRHFADDIFKCIFLNETVWIPIKFSLKFVPKGPINYIPALVQIMAWRQPGDKPSFEPMMISLLTHICVTRPQWVKVTRDFTSFKIHQGNLLNWTVICTIAFWLEVWKTCFTREG